MSLVSEFLVEGGIYYHDFCLDNDSNLLCDFDGNPLILYTRHGNVEDVRKMDKNLLKNTMEQASPRIGRFRADETHWIYESNEGVVIKGIETHDPDSLLKTEILVSRHYIPLWFPLS